MKKEKKIDPPDQPEHPDAPNPPTPPVPTLPVVPSYTVSTTQTAGGDVRVSHCGLCAEPRRIFNFSGGVSALELRMAPDREGNFGAVLSVM